MSDDTRPPPTRHSTDLAVEAIADLASKSIAVGQAAIDLDGAMRRAAAMLLAQAYDDINTGLVKHEAWRKRLRDAAPEPWSVEYDLLAAENKRLAARIDHISQRLATFRGRTVALSCELDGNPAPKGRAYVTIEVDLDDARLIPMSSIVNLTAPTAAEHIRRAVDGES